MKKLGVLEWILIGFLAGIIAGAIAGPAIGVLKPLGILFLNLLKMLVVPLIFSTLVVGVSSFSGAKLGRMFGKTFFFYYITGILAIVLGLAIATISGVGTGMELGELKQMTVKEAPPFREVLLDIIPTNPIKALAEGNILQVIFFAIVFGMSMGAAGSVADPVRNFFEAVAETMYKLVGYVLWYGPIGVFALMAWTVGTFGLSVLKPFAYVIFLVYLGSALQLFLVYGGLLRAFGIRPLRYFNRIKEAPLFAFTTCSSSATLPITMRVVKETGVSGATSSFVLPMGATINMDGTGLYQAITAVFLANAFGIDLSIGHMVLIGMTALLASIGTAGVPGAGLIMLSMVLGAIGVPVDGIGLIVGIDRILDMARTAINVTDDATAAILIAKSEGDSIPADLLVK